MTAPLIRLDDFPNGHRGREPDRDVLAFILKTFNAARVRYILGVSPLLLQPGDVEWLNAHIGDTGAAVMHGWDHAFSWPGDWKNIAQCWREGGEFGGAGKEALLARWGQCHKLLCAVKSYDPKHFIAPFNVYTQALLDALQSTPVEQVHGMNTINDLCGLCRLFPGKLRIVLATDGVTYGRIWEAVNAYQPVSPPITLHWIYDSGQPNWQEGYRKLAALAGGA